MAFRYYHADGGGSRLRRMKMFVAEKGKPPNVTSFVLNPKCQTAVALYEWACIVLCVVIVAAATLFARCHCCRSLGLKGEEHNNLPSERPSLPCLT